MNLEIIKNLRIEDFDYPLPDERIARYPLKERDSCRLLLRRPDGIISHRRFTDLPGLLAPATMLVCNDTRVINARLSFRKSTGSRIEIFLLEPENPADYALNFQSRHSCVWKCLVGNLKKWKDQILTMRYGAVGSGYGVVGSGYGVVGSGMEEFDLRASRIGETGDGEQLIEFSWDNPDLTFGKIVELAGDIPIPPYLKRESEESDRQDYQTVYARTEGSVAAPTAGLHFTPSLFDAIRAHAVKVEKLTLHVGAGTFRPVKSEEIGAHEMHTETFTVTADFVNRLISQKRHLLPVTAVGTTSVRTLESLPYLGRALQRGDTSLHIGQWEAYETEDFDTLEALEHLVGYMQKENLKSLTGSTAIMIAPGFRWRITDAMVTNFHQPQSTLLLLVSSFLGNDSDGTPAWRALYDAALKNDYRFLSYGDAMLVIRR